MIKTGLRTASAFWFYAKPSMFIIQSMPSCVPAKRGRMVLRGIWDSLDIQKKAGSSLRPALF
jgi:hypothetical protein